MLLTAVAHSNEEQIARTIPNPHSAHLKRSGLGTAIDTIYTLANSTSTNQEGAQAGSSDSTVATSSTNRMHGAIITLGPSRNIIFASKSAPTHTVNGILQPKLLFNGSDSLDAWINECNETTVKAHRVWQRITDRPSDMNNQHIFDVYASFEKGSPYETVLTLVDMTDRYKEDEDNLNFIAFAAHELRGPITVIRGYLDVLQDELNDILEDDQRELFYRLSVSASRLSGYVNNILNTSRYDQRHLTLSLQPENIATIYAVIADDMSLRASSQNRLLAIDIPNSLPAIAADRASLSEVISNLIDNAIKYSNEGGTVTISATLHGDFVDISVTDQGIGMGADVVKHLFRKFYRSHRSRETVAGSGIGLYISKAIVESHGGTISVRSTEGAGSTFTVSIPTYASIADKLVNGNGNQEIISQGKGWIKNHSIYRG
jgi:signal transduction histidine kinase